MKRRRESGHVAENYRLLGYNEVPAVEIRAVMNALDALESGSTSLEYNTDTLYGFA
jgi:hypothetical protein